MAGVVKGDDHGAADPVTYNPLIIGHGYLQAAIRVEHRPGWPPRPEDKDEILAKLEPLHAAGVQAWWYSVSGKGSFPLFPSKHLPHHPDAVDGMYPWIAEEIHRRDMVAFSWEYMNTAPYYIREHPEDRMEFLAAPADRSSLFPQDQPAADDYIEKMYDCGGSPVPCYLSPYGRRLKDFCVEVVNDLNFDGIWFDGSMPAGVWGWPGGRIGCCCERCAKRFRDETGLTMPRQEDWADETFRQFIRWRYRFFAGYLQELCAYVKDHNPTALIGVNNFQSIAHRTGEGMPLQSCRIDGLMASEARHRPCLVPMMMKYLRAVSDVHPPEIWISQVPRGPHPIPDDMIYYGMLCNTAGGFMSMGLGGAPEDCLEALQAMGKALKPRAAYVGGAPLRYAGLVLSVSTIDFAYGGDGRRPWRSAHGMYNLLQHARLPVMPVLDDQATAENLCSYAVVVLPDVRCVSDAQAEAITEYVHGGGTLLVTSHSGILNELGQPRETPALDGLLGITSRRDAPPPSDVGLNGEWSGDLPRIMRFDHPADGFPPDTFERNVWAEFAEDVAVLAAGRSPSRTGGQIQIRFNAEPAVEASAPPAITCRKVGQGWAIYINRDIGLFYSHTPRPRLRQVLERLIGAFAPPPPHQVRAADHVIVEGWRQPDGRIFYHVLSEPENQRSIPGDWEERAAVNLCTIPPTGPVTIQLDHAVNSVSRPLGNESVALSEAGGVSTIHIENVENHDVIVVE